MRLGVLEASHADAAFNEQLRSDANSAITAKFGEHSLNIRVYCAGDDETAFMIPNQTDALTRSLENVSADLQASGRGPTLGEFEGLLALRAWTDATYAAQLGSDPRSAVNSELSKFGASVPDDKNVTVLFEAADECLIVLLPNSAQSEELSDDELEMVAGGEGVATSTAITLTIVGTIAVPIVDNVVDRIWSEGKDSEGGGKAEFKRRR